ncbi:Tripartite-type tricarboxylate transporter, receptor component TctC [Noviherbaspirillum humi]|uniref:Tripartite-type tricarboxylate transporter, receptor component TctC n=1 Tax=Noviherbaspirillum humi TaxID=1688639 RepID=A0A239KP51_9BURK|nr:Tripartite-type tricarboxylate transporter, receptor component TctC [Noviherbaspirillum humi]
MRSMFIRAAGATLLAALSLGASAQSYPAKPVRIVVTYPPGGGADVMARLIAEKLTASLGQTFVVENKPGASGQIGAQSVLQAPADGYTLMVDASSYAVNPALFPKLPYNPRKAFAPISLLALFPNVLVVHPSFPANSVKELVAMAKAKPGEINYASSGNGSAQHLAAELFKQQAGIDMQHVPYKGGGPAMTDVMAGQVPVFFANMASSMGHIKGGKLKPLAATGAKRAQAMPNLPTVSESGVPGYEVYEWNVLFAPAGTPVEIVNKLSAELTKVLNAKDVRDRIAALGGEVAAKTPQETAAFLDQQMVKWEKVVKAGNIKVD